MVRWLTSIDIYPSRYMIRADSRDESVTCTQSSQRVTRLTICALNFSKTGLCLYPALSAYSTVWRSIVERTASKTSIEQAWPLTATWDLGLGLGIWNLLGLLRGSREVTSVTAVSFIFGACQTVTRCVMSRRTLMWWQ
jgi:hypothetical protein